MKKKIASLSFAATLLVVLTCSLTRAAETKVLHTILYSVSETVDGVAIAYDGFRTASVDKDCKFVDNSGSELSAVSDLARAIGSAPNLKKSNIGDIVGKEMGDAYYVDLVLDDGVVIAIEAVERRVRPTIGVAWAGEDKVKSSQRVMADAVLRNGGIVYFLPKFTNEAECDEGMRGLDGFIMPGGTDVNPKMFDEEAYPHGSVGWDDVRDVSDALACRCAIERDLPALWVCRGEQMLNVVLGGALIQDVPSYLGAKTQAGEILEDEIKVLVDKGVPVTYDGEPEEPCMPAHYRVTAYGVSHSNSSRHSLGTEDAPGITEDSKLLRNILEKRYCDSVYSSHHQSVDPARLGKGLTIVAYSPDGIVEALEYQANKFALATQFHPEYDAQNKDPEIADVANAFFQALIDAAR